MNRSNMIGMIKHILLQFEDFKRAVLEMDTSALQSFFEKEETEPLEATILLYHQLFQTKTTKDVYTLFMDCMMYLSYLQTKVKEQKQVFEITFALAVFEDNLFPVLRKVTKIEVQRFLATFQSIAEYASEKQLIHLCHQIALSKEEYDYFIGFDFYDDSYEQLSFFETQREDSQTLDAYIGDRRIKTGRKFISDYHKGEPIKQEVFAFYQPLLQKELDPFYMESIQEELQQLSSKKRKKLEKTDYHYFSTLK